MLNHYARQHREHLKKHLPKMFRELNRSGKMEAYLEQIGTDAADMEDQIMDDLRKKDPLPKGYLETVDKLTQHRRTAREIVLNDLILLPAESDETEPTAA